MSDNYTVIVQDDNYTVSITEDAYTVSVDEFTISNAVRYQTGTQNPDGNVTPASVPAIYLRTDTNQIWIATGSTTTDWQEVLLSP